MVLSVFFLLDLEKKNFLRKLVKKSLRKLRVLFILELKTIFEQILTLNPTPRIKFILNQKEK